MEIKIHDRTIRLSENNRSLVLHWREDAGVCIISFEVCEGGVCKGGYLPDVEFSSREVLLRHLGNRIEQIP